MFWANATSLPFLGRIAIGWIVDVNTVVAVIVYGFISAAAYRCAGKNGDRVERVTGMAGMALMVGFGIVELFPAVFNTGSMATESYFPVHALGDPGDHLLSQCAGSGRGA